MAYYNKIGLLVLNSDSTKFLVLGPGKNYGMDTKDLEARKVRQYLMPGGQLNAGEDASDAIIREIREELQTEVERESIKFISDYTDVSATSPDRDVLIKLYLGKLKGEPKLGSEMKDGALYWIGKEDANNEKVSPITRNKIIPDLVSKGILV